MNLESKKLTSRLQHFSILLIIELTFDLCAGSRHELLVTNLRLEGTGHKTFNCSASSDLGTRTMEVTVSGSYI